MSDKEPLLLCKEDFSCIGQVAKHCDWEQLCIYIREQQNLSLLPKVGVCLYDLLLKYVEGWCIEPKDCTDTNDGVIDHLWNGGRYESCGGNIQMHFGLKRVLVHWAYGAYIYRHGYVDTPFGIVQKINQDSVPVDIKELGKVNIDHRNAAEKYWAMTRDYLCSVKSCDVLSGCDICDCSCNSCSSRNIGGEGFSRSPRFKNISKN